MPKSLKILLAIIILILLIVICGAVYYFVSSGGFGIIKQNGASDKDVPQVTKEQQEAQFRKDYPETITGVINFFDTEDSYKATLKTDDGKEYTLYPPQPKMIYESFSAKEGQRVEVWGKISKNGNLEWSIMNPI